MSIDLICGRPLVQFSVESNECLIKCILVASSSAQHLSEMRVVSNPKHIFQVEIIKPMANFCKSVDFLTKGLALPRNHKRNAGSQVSTILVVTILSFMLMV